jgi:hypothetical protein
VELPPGSGEGDTEKLVSAEDSVEFSVVPEPGMLVMFLQGEVLHQGNPVTSGYKYILRSDAMYSRRTGGGAEFTPAQAEALEYHRLAVEAEAAGAMEAAISLYSKAYRKWPELEGM